MGPLSSRHILVTGAASGIGAALCARLRAAGERVTGTDRVAREGVLPLDLTRLDDAPFDEVASQCGPLNGCAHVAGLPGTHAPAGLVAVNVLAVRRLTRTVSGTMRPGAAIVAVSSITARRCSLPPDELLDLAAGGDEDILRAAAGMTGPDAYAFSKALLNAWVALAAARGLDDGGPRVNAVAPGPVETPILDDFRSSMGADRIEAAARVTGRHGTPDEVAAVAAFLLSPEARWMNGAVVDCDGGYGAARLVAAHRKELVA